MTCLVATVTEAFTVDKPADALDSGVIPFGRIPCAFPGKVALPDFAVLHEKFIDQVGVLHHAFFAGNIRAFFLPPFFMLG